MRVTAWKNGQHSSPSVTYGLSIPRAARDRFFDREWHEVVLTLPSGAEMTVVLRPTFWTTCSELRGAAIGRWLQDERLIPWPDGAPPSLEMRYRGANRFNVTRPLRR